MPVREVRGDTRVEPDHVYVAPASKNLRIENGILRAVARPTAAGVRNMAIDDFFESLAKDRGNLAFGIILSGTASDGTIGLKAIKSEGGITLAQEPSSAKFDGMPSSAIAAGAVDFVLHARSDRQAIGGARRPSLPEPPARRASRAKRSFRRPDGDLNPISGAAGGYGHRFHLLQAQHDFAAHRTPDGAARHRVT